MNIVVTRPRDQAAQLMHKIEQQGGNPLLFPLLEIMPARDQATLLHQIHHLPQADIIIFISPNAVKYGMAAIGKLPQGKLIVAVGQGTARSLRESGVSDILVPSERFDSEGVLALPDLRHVAGKRIMILRGDGGRELLGDTLQARGAIVEYVTCYLRGKPTFDAARLLSAQPDVLIVTSSEALRHLYELTHDTLLDKALFVIHERIAAAARELGWREVRVAGAGDDDMLAALIAWAKQRRE